MDIEISERYFQGAFMLCSSEPILDGYTNADMAGDTDSKKSTSGFLMTFAGGTNFLAVQVT